MGDWFQFVAATEVKEADAPAKGAELTQWLIREGIISPKSNEECVLGEEPGHPPGPRFADACEELGPNEGPYSYLNGVAVITTRHVYHNGQGGMDLRCAACGAHFGHEDEDGWRPYTEAISDWWETGTPGMVKCIRCETERSIVEWQRDGPWVVAYLGLEIWNWPQLSKEFLAKLEEIVGSPVRYIVGKF